MRGDVDIGTPAEKDAGGVGDDAEELAAGAEEAGDALDAGAGVVLVAEEVLEGEEAGDGVEVLRGGEERELEDVAGDEGGGDAVEAVFIPETDRGTLCISSQAGCAVGCRFCSTGHQGFSRNLSTAEIVAQLWFAEHFLRKHLGQSTRVISNVVMMGMGEPLQNYAALIPALRVMLSDHGYGLSRRRVTVSTSGVVPMVDRLALDCPVALAVSLHAPEDLLRDQLVPLNRKYPLAELLSACARYLAHAPRDFITFEYCMLDGVNDSVEQAQHLVRLLGNYGGGAAWCKLNLIPFNPFPASGLLCSPPQRVQAFAQVLMAAGLTTTIRKTRGQDIDAACGQLAGDVMDRTRVQERMSNQRTVKLVRGPVAVAGVAL